MGYDTNDVTKPLPDHGHDFNGGPSHEIEIAEALGKYSDLIAETADPEHGESHDFLTRHQHLPGFAELATECLRLELAYRALQEASPPQALLVEGTKWLAAGRKPEGASEGVYARLADDALPIQKRARSQEPETRRPTRRRSLIAVSLIGLAVVAGGLGSLQVVNLAGQVAKQVRLSERRVEAAEHELAAAQAENRTLATQAQQVTAENRTLTAQAQQVATALGSAQHEIGEYKQTIRSLEGRIANMNARVREQAVAINAAGKLGDIGVGEQVIATHAMGVLGDASFLLLSCRNEQSRAAVQLQKEFATRSLDFSAELFGEAVNLVGSEEGTETLRKQYQRLADRAQEYAKLIREQNSVEGQGKPGSPIDLVAAQTLLTYSFKNQLHAIQLRRAGLWVARMGGAQLETEQITRFAGKADSLGKEAAQAVTSTAPNPAASVKVGALEEKAYILLDAFRAASGEPLASSNRPGSLPSAPRK
jgi:hypothetical protein